MSGSLKTGLPDRLAHDLRGPLAPLQTAVYLLRTGQLDDARREELHDLLDRQAKRLGGMIDELDDWLRAGQDRLVAATTRVEPVQLLEVAMTRADCAGGEPPDIDDDSLLAVVDGDQRRLVQVLRTLLDHARAHAGGTPPRVRVRGDGSQVLLDVIAAGGPVGDVEALFSQPLPHPGEDSLGLRLLIAHAITRAHGGSLDAADEDGHLRLRCALPLAAA
ncbi:MAG TPA: HAMP domain-containing sensor histidine kinase [Xanthomonadaceae bacterium]|nr:HAMP domain-containing sensor histidine kinase [Xanthomonadaceae bacterium]